MHLNHHTLGNTTVHVFAKSANTSGRMFTQEPHPFGRDFIPELLTLLACEANPDAESYRLQDLIPVNVDKILVGLELYDDTGSKHTIIYRFRGNTGEMLG